MSLLSFLVTSGTRKELLNLLWVENVETSGHQLALLAKAAYSSVHGELEAMREEGLVSSKRQGRAEVFAKNDKYPFRKALMALLVEGPKAASPSTKDVSDNDVRFNLAQYGAPLVVQQRSDLVLALEETLAAALGLARRDATVSRALPVVFARNKNKLDMARLEYLSRKHQVLPVLGFFLELTALLSKDRRLHLLAKKLMDRRRKKMENFFVGSESNEFEQELAEINTPPFARKWNFLMNMGMDSFESLFKKNYVRA